MTVDQMAEIIYDELHKDGYANTYAQCHEKTKYRAAIAKLITAMNRSE